MSPRSALVSRHRHGELLGVSPVGVRAWIGEEHQGGLVNSQNLFLVTSIDFDLAGSAIGRFMDRDASYRLIRQRPIRLDQLG